MFELGWAKNGTPDTLTGTSDTLNINDLSDLKFNVILQHLLGSSTTNVKNTYNSDTASNYADRYSQNGGVDGTRTSKTVYQTNVVTSVDSRFIVTYFINIATEEKLTITHVIENGTVGAATAPSRNELVGKWVDTTNPLNETTITNTSAGDYTTDSNVSALGTN